LCSVVESRARSSGRKASLRSQAQTPSFAELWIRRYVPIVFYRVASMVNFTRRIEQHEHRPAL
jgi:hypothetical protein